MSKVRERVNHPEYYTPEKIECIDALEVAIKDLQGMEAFCTANIIKYMWRWKRKNGLEDLRKANWYLNKLIQEVEGKNNA